MASSFELPATARKLEGKVAVVTGGASGIGECTARLFCRHGAKVVIADIEEEKGNAVSNDLDSAASFIRCDVTNEDDVSRAVDHAIEKFGKLDIMFNNAGIIESPTPSIVDSKKSDFERVIGVNLVGAFLGTKHAARVMIPALGGCIIATASIAATSPGIGTHAYSCSKHAIVGLTKNAAFELGQFGIRVNCVSPGAVATPLTRTHFGVTNEECEAVYADVAFLRTGSLKADDIANAVLYLASDDSRYVSGHNLVVDGAYSVGNPTFNQFVTKMLA